MECEFCEKQIKTISSLNYHKKTNKKCLKIQEGNSNNNNNNNNNNSNSNINSLKSCEFCNKDFSNNNLKSKKLMTKKII